MSEEANDGVNGELATPATETNDQVSQGQPQESEQDRNWKAMREKMERERMELELEREKRAALESYLEQYKHQEQKEDEPQYSPDDLLTYEEYQKLDERNFERRFQERYQRERNKEAQAQVPQRLRSQYEDFESVVTKENLSKLEAMEPEVAQAFGKIEDVYAQGVAVYKYLKTSVPKEDQETKDAKQRIADNADRPGTLGSIQGSPLSQAGAFERGLSKSEKQALYEEMLSASRGY